MNKMEFIKGLAKEAGLDPNKGSDRALIDTVVFKGFAPFITKSLSEHERLTIANFISFKKSQRKARKGRNPATGQAIDVPAKVSVNVRLHKSLYPEV